MCLNSVYLLPIAESRTVLVRTYSVVPMPHVVSRVKDVVVCVGKQRPSFSK